jgi:hypothetical protein
MAPAEVNPAAPPALSQIMMHLLEKEPDHRYETVALLDALHRDGLLTSSAAGC